MDLVCAPRNCDVKHADTDCFRRNPSPAPQEKDLRDYPGLSPVLNIASERRLISTIHSIVKAVCRRILSSLFLTLRMPVSKERQLIYRSIEPVSPVKRELRHTGN